MRAFRRLVVGILFCLGLSGVGALAQVRIDIPGGRGRPDDGPDVGQIVGGLLALKDGYDRSRRGFICVQTYNDLNANGARDKGEGPLPGWSFTVTAASGAPTAQGQTDAKGRFCNEKRLPPGAYRVGQASGAGWVNTEPGAASPNTKNVTLPADKSVIVLFGNCTGDRCGWSAPTPTPTPGSERGSQPPPPTPQTGPELRFKKVVQSTAPGGGYPLTGLMFGNMFEIFHSCALGGLTYTNVTDVPGGATLPTSGHTNIPVGAICTVTETPPQGTIPWAPCPTGTGHWATPVKSPHPLTMAPGANVITVTNEFICDAPPPTASICVTKYHDLNGNGVRDPGEPLLPGWIFSVKTSSGTMISFGTTNSLGQFCTPSSLAPGGYSIFETQKPGWTSTNPGGANPTKAITLVAGQAANVEFGNRTPRVCVTKYNDLNGNGARATSEPGLPGWAFSIKNSSGVVIDSGVTDAQGLWCTSQPLPVGSVTVVEAAQSGWFGTDPGGSSLTKTLTLAAGQTANVKFGNWIPPSTGKVCVVKFRDLNSNGIYDSFEPHLSGWGFVVTGPSGSFSLTTGTSGKACTPATLAQGAYTVVETMQAGWTSTTPGGLAPQRTVSVTPNPGNDLYFGNVQALAGQICIEKYHDLNRNGRYDAGEPPLAGWTFKVTNASGVLVATGTTNAAGHWCSPASPTFPPGVYTVTEVTQPGWVVTEPQGPPMASPPYDQIATVNATRGADLHFGNIRSGQACITKYNDLNANGQRDPGEPTIAGVTFRGRYDSWVAAAGIQVVTGANGTVCVDLPPGPHLQFDETMQAGWTSTDPVGTPVGSYSWVYRVFTVVEGQTTNLQFGNHKDSLSGRICINKFNDLNGDGVKQANEPLLPFWTFNITGPSGPLTGSTSYNNGQWCTLQTLSPGTYQVTETPKPGWVRTKPGGTAPQMPAVVTIGQTTTLSVGNHLIQAPARLCVTKYNDLNQNGVRDAGEALLGGWQFSVKNAAGGVDDTGYTNLMGLFSSDPDGVWCTTQPLAAGTVSVVETLTPGWISTSPGGATPTRTAVLIAGQTTNVAFGNYHLPPAPGGICVAKFKDLNGDGLRQTGEPPLAGWTFTLAGTSGPLSGATDAAGKWCTPQVLTPGTYTVTETMQAGWTSTAPGGLIPQISVAVAAGQSVVIPFGNRPTPAPGVICVTKYSDLDQDGVRDSGEPGLEDWVFNLETTTGVSAGTLTTGANGKACIELPAGPYRALEVAQAGWTNTDPTGPGPQKPFTVISNQTVNIAFGNHQKPQPLRLTIQKTLDQDCGGVGISNPCVFRIRIRNVASTPYTGPVTFTDSVDFHGAPSSPGSTVLIAPLPVGWSCTGSSAPITCTGSVSLAPSQSVDVVLTMNLIHVVTPSANCARLTAPVTVGPSCLAVNN